MLLVTGAETGAPPDVERLREVQRAVPDRPVWIASGVDADNVREFAGGDGFIIGSAFERGGRAGGRVEWRRVRAVVQALKRR